MRKALVVGIDYYAHGSSLHGCVKDAHAVKGVLERHSDGSPNFAVELLCGTGPSDTVDRAELKDRIADLFQDDPDVSLLYFAGHGHIEATGGYLLTSECARGDAGINLDEILTLANDSKASNRVIILDSCHSGIAGSPATGSGSTHITEGMTILTASTETQYATEENDSGVFTTLFVDALHGSAANLVGDITPGSIYAHIDQSLGPWEQRPVFKTNIKSFISLRKTQAPIPLNEFHRITEFFPTPGYRFPLDPSFEPERDAPNSLKTVKPDPKNTEKFAILQKFNRVNLLAPDGAPHMWHAAINSQGCKLTVLGEHYRRLVEKGQI